MKFTLQLIDHFSFISHTDIWAAANLYFLSVSLNSFFACARHINWCTSLNIFLSKAIYNLWCADFTRLWNKVSNLTDIPKSLLNEFVLYFSLKINGNVCLSIIVDLELKTTTIFRVFLDWVTNRWKIYVILFVINFKSNRIENNQNFSKKFNWKNLA